MSAAEVAHEWAARLPAVGLDAANARGGLQRRIDRKYILGTDELASFLATAAGAFAVVEIDGRRLLRYRSAYFDTAQSTSYRDHVQRRRRRYKCRRREYLDTGTSMFEVKLKGRQGLTVKHRLRTGGAESPGVLSPEETEFFVSTVDAEYGRVPSAALARTIEITYTRLTLVSLEEPERITCDLDVVVRDERSRSYALDRDVAIVETKSARGRSEGDRLLRGLHLRPLRLSKYVVGTAVLAGTGGHDFRRAVRRFAAEEAFFDEGSPE